MPTNSRESKVPVALSQGRILQRMLRLNSVSVSVILVIVLGTYLISPDVQSYLKPAPRNRGDGAEYPAG